MQSSPVPQSHPRLHSTKSESAQDALVTASTDPLLEQRQNSPQDCANLIAASVDRATVEISRTIIALNATFSQQLQQASISASNGIKSAENSASSSISVVSQNASSATSSASFSLNLANLAVTSVNSALATANIALASAQSQVVGVNLILTSALSASTSDVLRLSSSLSSLEATLVSVKASASTAAALAIMSQQSLEDPQMAAAISLAPTQLAGIVVGTMVASVLLSFMVGFVWLRIKDREKKDRSIQETTRDLGMPLSRSSALRTGNSVAIKFSPPASVHDYSPAAKRNKSLSTTPADSERKGMPRATSLDTRVVPQNPSIPKINEWPLTSSFDNHLDKTANAFWCKTIKSVSHNMHRQKSGPFTDTSHASQSPIEDIQASTLELPPIGAAHDNTIERPIHAAVSSDPVRQPDLTFEPMHQLAGDIGQQLIGIFHEDNMEYESFAIQEPSEMLSCRLGAEELERQVLTAEAYIDPFADPVVDLQESIVDRSLEDSVEQQSAQPERALRKSLADHSYPKGPIDQVKTSRKEGNKVLLGNSAEGVLTPGVEDFTSESGPSSPVIASRQYHGVLELLQQSGIPIEHSSSPYKKSTSSEQVPESGPPIVKATDTRSLPESRDGTSSALRQNPLFGFSEIEFGLQSRASVDGEREVSPLRRNPPFEAMGSLLAGQHGGSTKSTEVVLDEHEPRGRSIIRTSDVLEARLSGSAEIDKSHDRTLQQRDRQAEPGDSRPASPAGHQRDSGTSDYTQTKRTPQKQEPLAKKQEISTEYPLPLGSNSLCRQVSATSHRDESSPLRQNPPGIGPDPRQALDTRLTEGGNTNEFYRALSKFQTLASQSAQDAVLASNEVTSRAIAGIYIPHSLREQAVRNLSKSRERGAGERQNN